MQQFSARTDLVQRSQLPFLWVEVPPAEIVQLPPQLYLATRRATELSKA